MSVPGRAPATWRFEAIGTRWEIETPEPLSGDDRGEVAAVIEAFDREWSRFRDDSVVSRLARDPRRVRAPADTVPMLDVLADLAEATGGAVNPLVGGVLARRGYDEALSLVDGGPVPAPDPKGSLSWSSEELVLRRPAVIDVGAVGKGRLVDLVVELLRARLAEGFVVDAGGDIRASGRTVRVGLEHPFDSRRAIGVAVIDDAAICASATNRRRWGDGLHHVLDARTGHPVRSVAATWAFAPDAMTADAASTALFHEGGAQYAHRVGAEWVRMLTDGRVEWSPGRPAELFRRTDTVSP
jgi:thiamine biosynthesis lipoprotein